MKQFYSLLILLFISITASAQSETYEMSLQYIGINSVTNNFTLALVATPNANVSNQLSFDMAVGVSLPTGYTPGNFQIGNSNIPATEWASSALFGAPTTANGDPGHYINREIAPTNIFFTFNSGDPIQLIIFDVVGSGLPTSGEARIVTNGDASQAGFLENYINMGTPSTTNRYGGRGTNDNIQFSSLGVNTNELNNTSIYPNPVKDNLYISDYKSLTSVVIYDISGKKVINEVANLEKINVSQLNPGVYFVKISTENSFKTMKLVKQ